MKLTRTDYALVRLAGSAAGMLRLLGDVETEHLRRKLEAIRVERPVFLTGLARSGTTILLEELAATGLFATHQYRDFIKPSELAAWLREAGFELEDVSGLVYEPWRNAARIGKQTSVNYLACARKRA